MLGGPHRNSNIPVVEVGVRVTIKICTAPRYSCLVCSRVRDSSTAISPSLYSEVNAQSSNFRNKHNIGGESLVGGWQKDGPFAFVFSFELPGRSGGIYRRG